MHVKQQDELAEVVLSMGRWHLRVAGLFLAMEGDPCLCRDPHWPDRFWTRAALQEAAAIINSSAGTDTP